MHGHHAHTEAAHTEEVLLRRRLRSCPRPRPHRRAVGAAGRQRATARTQALHRPQGGPAQCEPQRPGPAPEGAGVVRRRKLPPPAASRVYELTEWGLELEPVIISLGRWGAGSPSRPRDAALGVDSLILSLRTMFDAGAAKGIEAHYELRLGEEVFRAEVADGRFEIARGNAERPDATIESDAATLGALVYEGGSLAEALRSGEVKIEGERSVVERFLTLFPLPEPAAPAVVGRA